jgi:hypothetical protein
VVTIPTGSLYRLVIQIHEVAEANVIMDGECLHIA